MIKKLLNEYVEDLLILNLPPIYAKSQLTSLLDKNDMDEFVDLVNKYKTGNASPIQISSRITYLEQKYK